MRRIPILLVFLLAAIAMTAGNVSEQQAYSTALNFAKAHNMNAKAPRLRLAAKQAGAASNPAQPAYYVFNVGGKDDGFVIVSGDDRMEPVFGYCTSGNYDVNNVPDGLKWMLETYTMQVESLGKTSEVKRSVSVKREAISPLIQTHWNQGAPYNLLCPEEDGEKCLTGCVATAMAQIMYYFKCPSGQTTDIPDYAAVGSYKSYSGLPATTFDWENMKLTYDGTETDESAQAVAKLMLYCGHSAKADYHLDVTGANIPREQFADYFGYSKQTKHRYRNSDDLTDEWNDIIYNELKVRRPVLYYGFKNIIYKNLAHLFICDGYDGNGYFHINWGWGGQSDGYYLLSDLKTTNDGSVNDAAGFLGGQEIIYNFMPASEEDPEKEFFEIHDFSVSDTTMTRVNVNGKFTGSDINNSISVNNADDYNSLPENASSEALGLYKDGVLQKIVATRDVSYFMQPFSELDLSGIGDGAYQLKAMVKAKGTSDYKLCYGSDYIYLEATVKGNTLKLKVIGRNYWNANSSITISDVNISGGTGEGGKFRRGDSLTINLKVKNIGYETEPVFLLRVGDRQATNYKLHVDANATSDVKMKITVNKTGEIPLKIEYNGKELYSTTLTVEDNTDADLTGYTHLSNWKNGTDGSLGFSGTVEVYNNLDLDFNNNLRITVYGVKAGVIQPSTVITKPMNIAGNGKQDMSFELTGLDKDCESYQLYIHYYSGNDLKTLTDATLDRNSNISTSWLVVDEAQDFGTIAKAPDKMTITLRNKSDNEYVGDINVWTNDYLGYKTFNNVEIPVNGTYNLEYIPEYDELDNGSYNVVVAYREKPSGSYRRCQIKSAVRFNIDKDAIAKLSGTLTAGEWTNDPATGLTLQLTLNITNNGSAEFNDSLAIVGYPIRNNEIFWEEGEGDMMKVSIPSNENLRLTPSLTQIDPNAANYDVFVYYKVNDSWSTLIVERVDVPHDATGIENVNNNTDTAPVEVYDLTGRHIGTMSKESLRIRLPKGIYIVNGKKVVVK